MGKEELIKPTGINAPNDDAFFYAFQELHLRDSCSPLRDEMRRFVRNPALPTESRFAENIRFHLWQRQNKYFGKHFSILGDSISTLAGYNPEGYNVFYCGDNCTKANVSQMRDTWWDKVISFFGGELLVNNSWSGSRVTKEPGRERLFPSGCSDERTSSLHINDVMPDVILVYMGTNDWGYGARTGDETILIQDDTNDFFSFAYVDMLRKLRKNYPQSEIWCCTLCETFVSKHPGFHFPHQFAGIHIEEYNDIIRKSAADNRCRLIDLYNFKIPYDTMDGTHPNSDGMNTLATMIIRAMAGHEADQFLDCDHDNQDKYVGKIIGGRYWVQRVIGQGGHYTSYLVQDIKSDKIWAMKACDKTNRNNSLSLRENILQEPYLMMKMKHPAIPAVVDVIEDNESIFIVREYAGGVTLDSVVKDHGAQPADKVVEWGKQLCDVLGYLHKLTPPHIYRDMKPANIILTPENRLKLIDFSLVRVYDPMKDGDTCRLGTRGYAAPEQYGGSHQSDARTDIFGLGMTMHHLVTGVDPKQGLNKTKPIREVDPNLPKGLEYIITKCTQADPNARYQNCDELMADLNNYMNLPKPKGLFYKLRKK